MLDKYFDEKLELVGLKNIGESKYEPCLLKATRAIPISYLNYYYFRDETVRQAKAACKCRGEICKELESDLLELYKNPELKEIPAILSKRGGAYYSESAVSLIDAIENDKNSICIVDVKNNGAYGFMDKNDVVEVKCIVNKSGVSPIKLESFNNHYIIGLIQSVKAYEKLAAKAALEGSYDAALAALMIHPLVGDYHKAKNVLDEILETNKEYLPRFF